MSEQTNQDSNDQFNDIFHTDPQVAAVHTEITNWVHIFNDLIIGQKQVIKELITCFLADGHALLEGVPGVAKTLMARILAKSIDTDFVRIQFTPDLMPSDIIGTSIFKNQNSSFEFKKGPIFSNIVLIDEINRAPAKTQSALFEVMEEKQISIDGTTYDMSEPFMVVATQNPIDHEGTYRLPEAQLDRFLFKIKVETPSQEDELRILQAIHNNNQKYKALDIPKLINPSKAMNLKTITEKVTVSNNLLEFISKIVYKTRQHKDIFLGSSPRGSIAILKGAKGICLV